MSLLVLSNEVLLDHIFTFLEIPDLFKLMHSCSRLSHLLRDANHIWKKKFKERWPCICFHDTKNNEVNWMERVSSRLWVIAHVRETVRRMSPLCYPESPEKHTPEDIMETLTTGEYPHLEFVEDELARLKFRPGEEVSNDITFSYYTNYLYKEVKMVVLRRKWATYMALPESEKSLFEGALLMSHWINMDYQISPNYSDTELTLNWIVDRVKFLLMKTKNYSIDGQIMQATERETLFTLNQVMFQEMRFLNQWVDDDEVEDRERHVGCGCFCAATFSVDLALASDSRICENGILCIIYQEVARRLGISCEPVSVTRGEPTSCTGYSWLVLRWMEFPEQEEGFTYIYMRSKDCFKRIDGRRRLLAPFYDSFEDEDYFFVAIGQSVSTAEITFWNMLKLMPSERDYRWCNVKHDYRNSQYWVFPTSSICRLLFEINPFSSQLVKDYKKLCKSKGIQYAEAIRRCKAMNVCSLKLEELLAKHREKVAKKVICHRLPEIKYAVGLIMIYKDTSKQYALKQICVITSWDKTVLMPGTLFFNKLRPQPFYHVLLDMGKSEYVREDKLELHPDARSVCLRNHELGLHFVRFNGRRYVPNAEKNLHFPEDDEYARSLVGED